ncbi:TOPRIM nucleotidyl transferase/hydrolase domain-containing protein [Micromonospora sp. WMMD708]|uniref:TOPRIM nucleotidyl transferase/hydrolase domain-containing protein n=1 Tax=Micromonospora sp. WMMD708 TaxID=3403464 RepID=UPI003BF4E8F9
MPEPDRFRVAVLARRLAGDELTTVVLVEGVSDRGAVGALAVRRGRDLPGEGVCVLPIGGAASAGRFLRLLGPSGHAGVEESALGYSPAANCSLASS